LSGSSPEGSVGIADAIVVAAGRSERMGGIDKILAPVAGRPLLAWTLDGLAAVPAVARIVVVSARERVDELRAMPWLPGAVVAVVPGGDRRQASVVAGFGALGSLDATSDDGRVVLVHDGARPIIDVATVEAVIAATVEHGAAVPILPIAETVKRVDGDLVGATVDRDGLGVAQTPQGVRKGILREAYGQFPPAGEPTFTDEAALLEACRIAVHVVPGDPNNLKVTRPSDLRRAEAALAEAAAPGRGGADGTRVSRVGIGQDHHPFGPGSPLALGGVVIDGAPRLHGHSDGDVAVHAVCDALLGAAALGDLGRLFPAGPSTPEGIASVELLDEVLRQVTAAGWRVGNVDLTIVAARPRLGDHLDRMRDALAVRLGIAPGNVNVKASSGNLLGDEGAGRSISATAVALLEPAS
jgi:2-C-methyl-D-erythritol 4-phosphate cytidylyltransferase / 2-C-methyl-D-erythritol 2,4-cyclodiphosphate synthase